MTLPFTALLERVMFQSKWEVCQIIALVEFVLLKMIHLFKFIISVIHFSHL